MDEKQTDFQWTLQQSVELVSWTGISWFVALFLGLWGVMIGLGAFFPAYVFFGICILLCAIKWAHSTEIHTSDRRSGAFIAGMVFLFILAGVMVSWTHSRSIQAEADATKLAPLADIPILKKQLEDLPKLKRQITDLQAANEAANSGARTKQGIIEGLAQTVIAQQKTIAESAHKDLQKTESKLINNINQYRTDTSTAASAILRPGRTLGDKRANLVKLLKESGPHDVAITAARGSREAINFSAEIESAFHEADWNVVRTQKLALMIQDGIGLQIVTKILPGAEIKLEDLTPGQLAAAKAFAAIDMRLDNAGMENGATGPVEIYVGLQ